MKLIYLASPHSHDDYLIMQRRYNLAQEAVAILQREGIYVLSPILHSHTPQMSNRNTKADYEVYRQFDEKLISVSDELQVLMIEGWDRSYGVGQEVLYAESLDKRIKALFINYALLRTESLEPFSLYREHLRIKR